MPRPRLIEEDKRVYNLVLGETMFGELHQIAFDQSKQQGKMVSVAQLIREAITRYLDETNTRR
jgi:malonyl CoA-acyl carrier protein transacylase